MTDPSKFTPHRSGPTTRRAQTTRHPAQPGRPLMIFVLVAPDGRLASVIEAESMDAAWTIATGWGDAADIAQKKAAGWRVWPCMVEWEERE